MVTIEHVPNGKPAPDIFWAAAGLLGVPIAQCLSLEDSYTGVLGASRAGAGVVYIPSGVPLQSAQALAAHTLEDMGQLAALVAA